MKKVLLVVFAALTVVACKQSNEKKDALDKTLTEFEAKWKDLDVKIKGFNDMLSAESKSVSDMVSATDSFRGKGVDSIIDLCKSHNTAMSDLKANYETELQAWNSDSKAFTDWKEKYSKGDIKVDSAESQFHATFAQKLDDWTKKEETWQAKVNEIKTNCNKHCEAIMAMSAMAPVAATPTKKTR